VIEPAYQQARSPHAANDDASTLHGGSMPQTAWPRNHEVSACHPLRTLRLRISQLQRALLLETRCDELSISATGAPCGDVPCSFTCLMGYIIRPNDLSDLGKWDADLRVRCRSCGRSAVFDLLLILNHFRSRGWNTSWDCVALRFICAGTPDAPGCGGKVISVGLHPRVKLQPPEPKLSETRLRQQAKRDRH
jgi:hypothetical protein